MCNREQRKSTRFRYSLWWPVVAPCREPYAVHRRRSHRVDRGCEHPKMRVAGGVNASTLGWISEQWLAEHRASHHGKSSRRAPVENSPDRAGGTRWRSWSIAGWPCRCGDWVLGGWSHRTAARYATRDRGPRDRRNRIGDARGDSVVAYVSLTCPCPFVPPSQCGNHNGSGDWRADPRRRADGEHSGRRAGSRSHGR